MIQFAQHPHGTLVEAAETTATEDHDSVGIRVAAEGHGAARTRAISDTIIAGAAPDSATEPDTDAIGEEIAELAAHLDAATYRLLVLLRAFDAQAGWSGFRTCAHWLHWRTGIALGAAREKVRVARALHDLPVLSDAMRRGVLSYSKARALTRVATPENETELLELALHGTAAHIERVVRAWQRLDRTEEAEQERRRHEARGVALFLDDDGSWVLRGRLDPEVGAALERALEAARESLYRDGPSAAEPPSGPQQRADAIGFVAEQFLAAPGESAAASGTRADRFQVVLHVDAAALIGSAGAARCDEAGEEQCGNAGAAQCGEPVEDPGMCELEDGARVSAETSRRLSCDAARVVMTHDATGAVLDVGRRTRTVPPSLRRALERRDGGCRFPGCGLRHCDAHHVRHWADGGATSLDNLVLLCRFHHRLVHEEGYTVTLGGDGVLTFRAPEGWVIAEVPPAPRIRGDAVDVLRAQHHDLGITAATAPLWRGGRLDVDLALAGCAGRHQLASESAPISRTVRPRGVSNGAKQATARACTRRSLPPSAATRRGRCA